MSIMPEEAAIYLAATLHTREQVLTRPSPVPASPGVYGWWFRTLPAEIDTSGCVTRDSLTLLYTGISPKKPPTNGKPPSAQNLRKRLRFHCRGNASSSTLRLTLGCLLADDLGIELRRYGSSGRRTFGKAGEAVLNEWMNENALVAWIERPEPWELEDQLIASLDLPLNQRGNKHNGYYATLEGVRRAAQRRADELPVFQK